jgi:hypothetical protein
MKILLRIIILFTAFTSTSQTLGLVKDETFNVFQTEDENKSFMFLDVDSSIVLDSNISIDALAHSKVYYLHPKYINSEGSDNCGGNDCIYYPTPEWLGEKVMMDSLGNWYFYLINSDTLVLPFLTNHIGQDTVWNSESLTLMFQLSSSGEEEIWGINDEVYHYDFEMRDRISYQEYGGILMQHHIDSLLSELSTDHWDSLSFDIDSLFVDQFISTDDSLLLQLDWGELDSLNTEDLIFKTDSVIQDDFVSNLDSLFFNYLTDRFDTVRFDTLVYNREVIISETYGLQQFFDINNLETTPNIIGCVASINDEYGDRWVNNSDMIIYTAGDQFETFFKVDNSDDLNLDITEEVTNYQVVTKTSSLSTSWVTLSYERQISTINNTDTLISFESGDSAMVVGLGPWMYFPYAYNDSLNDQYYCVDTCFGNSMVFESYHQNLDYCGVSDCYSLKNFEVDEQEVFSKYIQGLGLVYETTTYPENVNGERTEYNLNYYKRISGESCGEATNGIIGIEEFPKLIFSVSPNPSNGEFYLVGDFQKLNYQVINPLGQVVKFGIVSSSEMINIRNEKSGSYYLVLRSVEGVVGSEVLIVR